MNGRTDLIRVRASRLDLASFAAAAGMHPELVRRLVALDLLKTLPDVPSRIAAGGDQLWLSTKELATAARIQRLRAGFGINYASIGLVMELLDRIDHLEALLRHSGRLTGG